MAYTVYPGLFIRRGEDKNCSFIKKDYFIRLHKLFNQDHLNVKTSIKVLDSHRAYPYYHKKCDEIIYDTHFFDILSIVTAILLSDSIESVDALADYLTSDFFICKDEIDIACRYADRFAEKKANIENILNRTAAEAKKHINRQYLFVLFHEQGHALLNYNEDDERFIPFRYHFEKEYALLSEITNHILSIDLSAIKDDLDNLDKGIYDTSFTDSQEDLERFGKHNKEFLNVVMKGIAILDVEDSDAISREEAIYYACDYYLKGSGIKLLDRKQYEPDCLADGYTLQRLVSCQFDKETVMNQLKDTVFAYYSCLLTTDLITCVNNCIMNIRSEGYSAEDLVWNRLRLEREILNNIIRQYAFRQPMGFMIVPAVVHYAEKLTKKYHVLYARFCDRLFSVEHPDNDTVYYMYGTKEYEEYYNQIHESLKIDHITENW